HPAWVLALARVRRRWPPRSTDVRHGLLVVGDAGLGSARGVHTRACPGRHGDGAGRRGQGGHGHGLPDDWRPDRGPLSRPAGHGRGYHPSGLWDEPAPGLPGQGVPPADPAPAPRLGGAVPSAVAGTIVLARVSSSILLLLLGLLITIYALVALGRLRLVLSPTQERWVGALAGLCSGVIGGATSIFALPVVLYLTALDLPKEAVVATPGLWL